MSCSSSHIQKYEPVIEVKKDLEDELRGALIEAKESIEGKRKFLPGQANKFERNTLDNLINEMKALETKAK